MDYVGVASFLLFQHLARRFALYSITEAIKGVPLDVGAL